MSTFAVNLNSEVYVPVIAEDFQFTVVNQRVSGTQPMPPRVQCLTFINYNGVDVSQFLTDAGASAPTPQVVADDYWIPSKNVYTVHKLLESATSPAVPPTTSTNNVFMVIPIGLEYRTPHNLGGTSLDQFPLFIADSFHFSARSLLNDKHNKAQGAMGGAEVVLTLANFRGRAKWSQLYGPGSLPPVIPVQDFYMPIKYISAIFRIRNQLWL